MELRAGAGKEAGNIYQRIRKSKVASFVGKSLYCQGADVKLEMQQFFHKRGIRFAT